MLKGAFIDHLSFLDNQGTDIGEGYMDIIFIKNMRLFCSQL